MFEYNIKVKDDKCNARTGVVKTANGSFNTPAFTPVATTATVKALTNEDLEKLGAEVILSNTFHLHLRPGEKIVKKMGGLHKFMNWKRPIITDSGGFQAFSLGYGMEHGIGKFGFFPGENQQIKEKKMAKVSDDGVEFRSPYDGLKLKLNPKISMKIQEELGADIIFAFDECTSPFHDFDYTKNSLERTNRWAVECLKYRSKKQALFGIVQGGEFKELRELSSKFIGGLDFDGFGIGGSLGKTKDEMGEIVDWSLSGLPYDKPKHMLGIGGVDDLFRCIEKGVDTFDCVTPTRIARRGYVFIREESGGRFKTKYRINIDKKKYKTSKKPIDKNCECYTCQNHTLGYLNHLFRLKELTYHRLASIHNMHYILKLVKEIRESIEEGEFLKMKKRWMR
tara:strand:+ start:262 stop:1446 length:1185 start_codon:yes stop_codon:yes gene_type:complete